MRKNIAMVFTFVAMAMVLCACQSKTPASSSKTTGLKSPSVNTTLIPPATNVGIVPFSQPTSTGQLIAGNLPYDQGIVAEDQLRTASKVLRSSLRASRRNYTDLPLPLGIKGNALLNAPSPSALSMWLAYGQSHNIDFLLVPQIIHWHQREGGRVGVKSSAHVRAEFFLLDIKNQRVFRRSIFDEKQVGLAEDLTKLGTFFQRGGSWITAEEMTQEAINQAIKEMRL